MAINTNIKQVIQQMRSLVSEPENRGHIVKDQSCINMLKLSLEEKDEEILSNALEILFFITLPKENRPIIASQPEMMKKVKTLMTDFQSSPQCRKQSSRIWENLQDEIEESNQTSSANNLTSTNSFNKLSTPSSSVSGSTPGGLLGLRNTTNTIGLSSSLGVLSSQKNENRTASVQTYSFNVKGLVDDTARNEIETALIKVVGVISFSCNVSERQVTVRSQTPSSIVASAIRTSGYTNITPVNDNKENTLEPEYLPENQNVQNQSGSWLYSLISFGAPQEEAKRKKSQSNNSWFGRSMMKSLAETLNMS